MENRVTLISEEQYHAACTQWYWNTHRDKMLFTVDNNVSKRLSGWDRRIEGNRKKAMGVMPGVSDLVYIGYFYTAFIELKMSNGVVGIEQKEFSEWVVRRGHRYYVCFCGTTGTDQLLNFKNLISCLKQMDSQINTGK